MRELSKKWQEKSDPRWLLELSRSVVGEPDHRPIQDAAIENYIRQFSSPRIPHFDSPEFIEYVDVDAKHKGFFEILKKEALAYYGAFHTPDKKNVYAQEVIEQVQKIYGPGPVNKYIYNQDSMHHAVGNMVVAIAINAIRDMALVEYMHLTGELTDAEKDAGLTEINNRMSRVGINGINKMFEVNPAFEQFIANDTFSSIETKRPGSALTDKWTRAAFYNHQMEQSRNLSDESQTQYKERVIHDDFPAVEEEKNHYIAVHVKEVPPLDPALRKKYSPLSMIREKAQPDYFKKHQKVLDEIYADRKKHDDTSTVNARRAALRDGLALNHPLREKYAETLRNRMKGIASSDIIDVEIIDPKETRQLPGKGKLLLEGGEEGRGSHVKRLLGYGSGSDQDPHKKKEDGGHSTEGVAGNPDKPSNVGAAIATIGGTAAVGLLLASGNKDKDGKDGEDKEKSKGRALKFAALAGSAAVAVGGLIMWTKKPEFLYKPMQDLFRNLGFGRA